MNITGNDLIQCVAQKLKEENVLCYDTAIVHKIRTLTKGQLNQIVSFGDVTEWHNERVERAYEKEGAGE